MSYMPSLPPDMQAGYEAAVEADRSAAEVATTDEATADVVLAEPDQLAHFMTTVRSSIAKQSSEALIRAYSQGGTEAGEAQRTDEARRLIGLHEPCVHIIQYTVPTMVEQDTSTGRTSVEVDLRISCGMNDGFRTFLESCRESEASKDIFNRVQGCPQTAPSGLGSGFAGPQGLTKHGDMLQWLAERRTPLTTSGMVSGDAMHAPSGRQTDDASVWEDSAMLHPGDKAARLEVDILSDSRDTLTRWAWEGGMENVKARVSWYSSKPSEGSPAGESSQGDAGDSRGVSGF